MGRKKLLARRQERQNAKKKRTVRSLVGYLAYVLLALAVILFAIVVVAAVRHGSTSTDTSDAAAATADAGNGWIPITSDTPDAIIAAAHKTTMFNVNRSDGGDYLDISHLEAPILVRALPAVGSDSMPDYYVIPIDDTSGAIVGAAELALNSTHTAIQLTSIITYSEPRPHGQMPHMGISVAESILSTQSHTTLRSGTQPQLVYVPIDAGALESGEVTWNGGGLYPADPVWLIPGADGQNHLVGTDGHAYEMSSVPVMKQP